MPSAFLWPALVPYALRAPAPVNLGVGCLMFSAAVFDMDGLLIDSERAIRDAWQSAAQERGITISTSQYASVVGRASAEADAQLASFIGGEEAFEETRQVVISKLKVFPAKPGATELLSGLRKRKIPCAVASSSSTAEIRRRLEAVGLAEYFHSFAGGNEVQKGKPDPSVYLLAARRLGVSPEKCLAFEDSQNGIRSAVSAGMQVVAVPDLVKPDTSTCLIKLGSLDRAVQHIEAWFPNAKTGT
ncbi:HAD family phosphatase [Ideonella sp. B508-1]|uniref:HAD family hydrolase n=1 Tax=Ideonella sp. B508-1 TaxID=137716 RepID=UPI00278BE91A|nr:HAD family phosphatase [Ideonella sp. B508-1]